MRTGILSVWVLLCGFVLGAPGVINDADGYTNVRAGSSVKAKVIGKLVDGVVFDYYFEEGRDKWARVSYDQGGKLIEGFVHGSRVKAVEKLAKTKDVLVRCEVGEFDASKRKIEKGGDEFGLKIDGKYPWGVDGTMPRSEVKKVVLVVKGKEIVVDERLYEDLFQASTMFTVYVKGGVYFCWSGNSDGAGYYELVWVIGKDGKVRRWVGEPG